MKKKTLQQIISSDGTSFLSLKWCICIKEFFQENHWYNFYVPLHPIHCAKFEKKCWNRSTVMMMCHLWARNGSVALNEIFFWKNHNFYVLLGLFNGAKFKKKVLRADPELSLFIFFGPKMAHLPLTRIFSKKPLVQFSITSWCLSLRRFWNNLEWIQSYDSIIFELKCPNCPEWEFFWKDY